MLSDTEPGRLARTVDRAPAWLLTTGVYGWLFAGSLILVGAVSWLFGVASTVTVPLAVAVVLGAVFAPLVDELEKRGLPRGAGSGIVLLILLGAGVGTVWVTVRGVLSQAELIVTQVGQGVDGLSAFLARLDVPQLTQEGLLERLAASAQQLVGGVAGAVTGGLSGAAAFLFGSFLGAFMLFFILKDWVSINAWTARRFGLPAEVGAGILDDGVQAMRQYFAGVTLTGLIVAVIVAIAMWLLGLPLALSVAIVTWLTSYIPYVGAIVSSAFAVFVALGAGGVTEALIMLAVIIFAQNVLQTVIQNQISSEKLSIHPLAALLGTILGGVFAGLLGAMLAPALVAFALRAGKRVRAWAAGGEMLASEDGATAEQAAAP